MIGRWLMRHDARGLERGGDGVRDVGLGRSWISVHKLVKFDVLDLDTCLSHVYNRDCIVKLCVMRATRTGTTVGPRLRERT